MSNKKEEIQSRIEKLRVAMTSSNVDCYIICDDDQHGSEYISECFRTREYFSGFTGSNGKMLVTQSMAGLWTDGRYFIQAAKELEGSGIELFKMGEENVPNIDEYINTKVDSKSIVALDGDVVTAKFAKSINRIVKSIDIASLVWNDKPNQQFNNIYEIGGDSISEKINGIREEMEKKKASAFLLSKLDDIAWLFNLRGDDIEHTPIFFAYALVTQNQILLYVDKTAIESVTKNIESDFYKTVMEMNIEIMPYGEVNNVCNFIPTNTVTQRDALFASETGPGDKSINNSEDNLKNESCTKVMVDMEYISYSLYDKIVNNGNVIIDSQYLTETKAIKSLREIEETKQAHIQDGVAMTKFIYAMKNASGDFSEELSISNILLKYRSAAEGFVDLSFPSIVAFAENGAIAHYETKEESSKKIEGNNFLLIDSGSQYIMGTTDITRTFVVGSATDEMRKHYTLTLKSMMSLMWVKFKAGTKGSELDILPRVIMWEEGLDYNHGTGHGVGHLLCVHEGPNGIGKRYPDVELKEGNITTVEPGVYIEGKYGIRLENETLCVASEDEEYLILEPVTFCPFEREAIDKDMLTKYEIEKINKYNSLVYEKISPYLDDEEKAWLTAQTEPL